MQFELGWGMRICGAVIRVALSVLAILAAGATVYYWSRPESQPPPPRVVTPRTYSDDQVTAIWTGMRHPEQVIEIRDTIHQRNLC
ncbi:MAG: hypothetical protein HZB26_02415 [Candidatus Hydrogenedentes bacterium]|nr:hypothetical protein [Candidatus Hydrogenedentota bacterium]